MSYRDLLRCGVLLTLVGLGGCATIVNGTTESVSVDTMPSMPTKCTLTNSQGTWFVQTPGSVTVHKTKTDLKVHCDGAGDATGDLTVKSNFGAAIYANALMGLGGVVIGGSIDAASGANYYYKIPITVPMTEKQASN